MCAGIQTPACVANTVQTFGIAVRAPEFTPRPEALLQPFKEKKHEQHDIATRT